MAVPHYLNHASRVPFHQPVSATVNMSVDTDTDILSLRAQLKAFEKDFKAEHKHAPSVDDIKNAGFGATRVTSSPRTDPWLIITP
jgi:hypothetical protein